MRGIQHDSRVICEDIGKEMFDPVALSTLHEMKLKDGAKIAVYEKGFLPRELVQILGEAGFSVLNLWGRTACHTCQHCWHACLQSWRNTGGYIDVIQEK